MLQVDQNATIRTLENDTDYPKLFILFKSSAFFNCSFFEVKVYEVLAKVRRVSVMDGCRAPLRLATRDTIAQRRAARRRVSTNVMHRVRRPAAPSPMTHGVFRTPIAEFSNINAFRTNSYLFDSLLLWHTFLS